MQIPLSSGDRVVASFPWRDCIIVVTEFGKIFRVVWNTERDYPEIHAL